MNQPFILRHVVRDVLTDTDLADPGDLADVVLERIPSEHVHDALSQTLRIYVRQVISEVRNSGPAVNVAPIRPNLSWKVAGIRDGWQRQLDNRVHIGDGWKLLRNCSYDDLLAAAAERRDLADRNMARARQYDAWACLLSDNGAETFGDLPAEVQMQALGSAA